MAFSLNRAQIIGNLTRDPEVKQTPNGQKVASFGVATSYSWLDQSGQRKEKVEYHNIVAWRKLADICEQYVRKGRKIFVEGKLQTRDWEGEDGVKRYRTEIVADNIILLDRAGAPVVGQSADMPAADASSFAPQKGSLKKTAKLNQENAMEEEVNLEDLPF